MEIEIRYFDDCPNWRTTESLVAKVISELEIDAEVSLVPVVSSETAEQLRFQGSPTVMVNGVDPWAHPDAPVSLSCRVYRTESGFSGSPSEAQLREALGQAAN